MIVESLIIKLREMTVLVKPKVCFILLLGLLALSPTSVFGNKNKLELNDTSKFEDQFIHQQHELTKGKGNDPFKNNYSKNNLIYKAFNDSIHYNLEYEVFGWYPYWEQDFYKSINYSLLTTIAYFSYKIEPKTEDQITIGDWEASPILDSAKANGVNILLTITCFGDNNNRKFLKNDDAIENLIQQLKTTLKKSGANGICIDFEGVSGSLKSDYGNFISLLSKELKKQNSEYLIYMTVPSVDWHNSLDFETLIPAVDVFVIMGYGYYGKGSSLAGPTAPSESGKIWFPYNLTTSIDYYLTNKVPANKLILALPYYGAIWETKTNKKASKAKEFKKYRDYAYIKENVESKIATVQYDSASQTQWCSYTINTGDIVFRQCWFDNDSTIAKKISLIKNKNLRGMGIWALGYDKGYDNLWNVIADNLTHRNIDSTGIIISTDTTHSAVSSDTTGIKAKLKKIEGLLEQVTDYKAILLYIMIFVVIFGGIGFVIAMFKPNTRTFFFSKTAHKVYYVSFILIFLIVILRWTNVINDLSIALILGFTSGAIAFYFISKIIDKLNKDMP